MKKILVLDNYDSFTYNLVHILKELGMEKEMDIFRNDKISVDQAGKYENILLSPGPGIPRDAGIMPQLIRQFSNRNILGVCLGHQAIGEAFGGTLFNLPVVYHGVTTQVKHVAPDELYDDIPESFEVCRYHSWVVSAQDLPDTLTVTAVDPEGRIMGLKHQTLNIRGVQFHPESIMTEHGKKLMHNWLKIGGIAIR
ncbi:MAG: aminodeoxychorismate/anthranilate synthase component II [Cyclobacteriaceae bacterium]|nr:aminodeoxychorismate/anthranilate synthase component II [Cyclobacteriaceae bacterium]